MRRRSTRGIVPACGHEGQGSGARAARGGHAARAAIVAALSCVCGCTKYVTIYSEPTGAACYIDDEHRGETPLVTVVASWTHRPSPTIRLEKEGYEPYAGALRKKAQPTYIIPEGILAYGVPWVFNSALVCGEYAFVLAETGGSSREVPPRAAGSAEERREITERERGRVSAQIEAERADTVRPVIRIRWNPGASADGDGVDFHMPDFRPAFGVSAGVRIRGSLGFAVGYDIARGRSLAFDDDASFTELSVQVEAYLPLNDAGDHELAISARRIAYASLYGDTNGWKDGSGFGFDLGYYWWRNRTLSWRFGWRHEWLEFGRFAASGASSTVSDEAEAGYIYLSAEFRF